MYVFEYIHSVYVFEYIHTAAVCVCSYVYVWMYLFTYIHTVNSYVCVYGYGYTHSVMCVWECLRIYIDTPLLIFLRCVRSPGVLVCACWRGVRVEM